MMELDKKVDLIKERIQQLLDMKLQLINDKNILSQEIDRLKENEANSLKIISELENKSLNSQFDKSVENEDKNKLKTYIEELINEIDKGIKLLKS
jgi:hypothetical protein